MLSDYFRQEFELTCCHQVLALLVLAQVDDQLLEKGVKHHVLWNIIMLLKNGREPSEDHLCRHLIDLFVANFALVLLD